MALIDVFVAVEGDDDWTLFGEVEDTELATLMYVLKQYGVEGRKTIIRSEFIISDTCFFGIELA